METTEKDINEIDAMIGCTKPFVMGGVEYKIQKLTIGQTLQLIRFFTLTFSKNKDQFNQYKAQLEGRKTTNLEDMLALFDMLSREQLNELLGIILSAPDIPYLKEHEITLEQLLELTNIWLSMNNISTLKKNIQGIAANIKTIL